MTVSILTASQLITPRKIRLNAYFIINLKKKFYECLGESGGTILRLFPIGPVQNPAYLTMIQK